MTNHLTHIEAHGLYDRFDISQDFSPGINILFGTNGVGKTTLLHIIANILNGDFSRFAFLTFDSIKINFDDSQIIVKRERIGNHDTITAKSGRKTLCSFSVAEVQAKEQSGIADGSAEESFADMQPSQYHIRPPLPSAYFPAFRTIIEAWTSDAEKPHGVARQGRYTPRQSSTQLAREIFGAFTPQINFPSPAQIEDRVSFSVQQALMRLAHREQRLLEEAFLKLLKTAPDDGEVEQNLTVDDTLRQVQRLSQKLEEFPLQPKTTAFYGKLRSVTQSVQGPSAMPDLAIPVLEAYRDLLEKRVAAQEEEFKRINNFLDAVNEFIKPKKIKIDEPSLKSSVSSSLLARQANARTSRKYVSISYGDSKKADSLRLLSSGERQIVTLIYAATNMSDETVVLIDEPEISLHVEWQRLLLPKMAEQLQNRQIIVCTHSPIIAAAHTDSIMKLQLTPYKPVARKPAPRTRAPRSETAKT